MTIANGNEAGLQVPRNAADTRKRTLRKGMAHWGALAPSLIAVGIFVYGFVLWTAIISTSASRMVPELSFVGLANYERLWRLDPWHVSVSNMVIFTICYITLSMTIGLFLAILVDQKIRAESLFRTLYLYPASLSFVVTGIVWKWLLNPGIGIQQFVRSLGFESFKFEWIIDPKLVMYAIVIAGVWQVAGFVMALFLAGLRSVDSEMVKAATLDGAGPWRVYFSIILPSIKSVFVSVFVLLVAFSVKTFDLVVTMTSGGPGYASTMPTMFMYDMAFRRNQLGISSASAIMILIFALIIVAPYLFMGRKQNER